MKKSKRDKSDINIPYDDIEEEIKAKKTPQKNNVRYKKAVTKKINRKIPTRK